MSEREVKPLAIRCYAAFSDGVIRGVWIDMDRKLVHIEPTPLQQVDRGLLQILDKTQAGTLTTEPHPTPQASEKLQEMQREQAEAQAKVKDQREPQGIRAGKAKAG